MAFEGNLADMSLLDLLRIFQRGARSGRLLLWTEAEWAMVWLRSGHAAHAVVLDQHQRRPILAGEPALKHLISWPGGRFRFLASSRPELYLITIKRPLAALVDEALQPDEPAAGHSVAPALTAHTPLQVLPELSADEGVHLSAQEWLVLTRVGQHTTPAVIAAQIGVELAETLAHVARLVELGLVAVMPEAPVAPVASAPTTARLSQAIRRRLSQQGAPPT